MGPTFHFLDFSTPKNNAGVNNDTSDSLNNSAADTPCYTCGAGSIRYVAVHVMDICEM